MYTAAGHAGSLALRFPSDDNCPATNDESDKARSMSGFKEPNFADRQKAAQEAKQNILNKFRSQPGADDPAVIRRRAEREAQAAERAKAKLAREAAKVEQKRREDEAAAEAAAKLAREKEETAAKEAALEAERKAARDARYAARKKRK
jgi:predicted RNA-binding protein